MLAYLQLRRAATVRTGELQGVLGLSADQERELFRRMSRGGLVARVRRGEYLVPERLPLGGRWSPDEASALAALVGPEGAYQLCGPNAFQRYGFDPQVPARLYVYNDRLSGERRVGNLDIACIRVARERLGDVEEDRSTDGLPLVYSSRVRTLIDAVYDWSRFGSLPRGYEWIRGELAAGRVTAGQLADCAVRFGDMGTRRRIAALLDRAGADVRAVRRLERTLTASQSLIPWIPGREKRGRTDRRFGIVWNDEP